MGEAGRDTPQTLGQTASFRRSLPETGCLSQGLPYGKRFAWPCPPKTVKHPGGTPASPALRFLFLFIFSSPGNRNPSRPDATFESEICTHHQDPAAPPACTPSCTSPNAASPSSQWVPRPAGTPSLTHSPQATSPKIGFVCTYPSRPPPIGRAVHPAPRPAITKSRACLPGSFL